MHRVYNTESCTESLVNITAILVIVRTSTVYELMVNIRAIFVIVKLFRMGLSN